MRPIPPGGDFDFMQTPDGVSIRYASWPGQPDSPTIVFLNGFRECIEKHFETVEDLQKRGFAVFTMDWRGQGLSTRALANPQKVHIEDFGLHVLDLHQFITQIVKPRIDGPVYLFAHSMGGHLALRYLHDERFEVDGAILCAPMMGLGSIPGLDLATGLLAGVMGLIGRDDAYATGGKDYGPKHRAFEGNRLTSDRERFEEEHAQLDAQPVLRTGGPTWGWMRTAISSTRKTQNERYLKAIGVPVYIIQAGADIVVSNRAQNWGFKRMNTAHFFRIEGSAHEILREKDVYRDQIWALVDRFFQIRA